MTEIKKTNSQDLPFVPQDMPFVLVNEEGGQGQVEHQESQQEFLVGDKCPLCGIGHLDYNGVLNLVCDQCRYALGGCFT